MLDSTCRHDAVRLILLMATFHAAIIHQVHAGFISELAPWGRQTLVDRWTPENIATFPSYLRISGLEGLAHPQLVILNATATNRKVLSIIDLSTPGQGSTRLIVSPTTLPLVTSGNTLILSKSLDTWLLSGSSLQKRTLLLFDSPTKLVVNGNYSASLLGSATLLNGLTLGANASPLADESVVTMSSGMVMTRISEPEAPVVVNTLASPMSLAESLVNSSSSDFQALYRIGIPDIQGVLNLSDPPPYQLPYWWQPAQWDALALPQAIPEPSGILLLLSASLVHAMRRRQFAA